MDSGHARLCDSIKKNVDLAGYVRSCGIELGKHGTKDLKGLCPFHDDKNPSLIISPAKKLFHCPVCGAGGSVIDFAMKFHKLTLQEAIRKLSGKSEYRNSKSDLSAVASAKVETNPKIETGENLKSESAPASVPTIPPERQAELLEKTASFYGKTFADVADGRKYLEGRGITDAGLFSKHRMGFSDGSLLKALPSSGKILDELRQLGILLANGSERFLGCVVVPVLDTEGNIVTLYGRDIGSDSAARNKRRHVYLPDRPTGLFNCPVMKTYPEIVIVESVIDALSLEMAGVHNVVSIQSTNGLSESGIKLLKEHGVTRVILLLDGDNPGREAAHKLMETLSKDFSVSVPVMPDGHDPNSYLVKFGCEKLSSLLAAHASADSAKEKVPADFANNNVSRDKTGACGGYPRTTGNSFAVQMGLRHYQVIGLEKGQRSLRATIRVEKGGKLHVDTLDFYSSRQRRQLAQDICLAFEELPETVEGDIGRLLQICEGESSKGTSSYAEAATADREAQSISLVERAEAEEFGRSENLIENILGDFEKCGLVGEEDNKLLCYLAMTSRKMDEPLSVLILSSSGAGKTALQDAALAFCPPEDLVKLTSLSARALFYKERFSLKHKVLAIEEGAGAEDASYAIRNLISSDSLTSEVAVRDPQTGKLTTMTNTVDGPASVFCTTTNPEVDPETRSRFLVTGIDESREQTRRILEFQRQRHSADGLKDNLEIEKILRVHRNFQRLLKPLRVVNPLVESLGYSDDRLQGRRAQPQYLNLISTVAFLRQMQKEIKGVYPDSRRDIGTAKDKKIEFIVKGGKAPA